VWVYHAGKIAALDKLQKGKLKIPAYLKPYINYATLESGSPEEVAKAYGAAVVRATQFMYGPEGRSLSFSGGAARRVIGQFKSFQQGYANLLLATLKDDPGATARLLSSLVLMGGVSAVVGDEAGQKILDVVRTGVAAAGGDPNWVPENSPIGKVFELFGFDSPVQIVGAATPISFQNLNVFTRPAKFLDFAAGPTLGSIRQAGEAAIKGAMGQIDPWTAATGMVRPFLPGTIGIAGLEAFHEAGLTPQFLDDLKYRGGIYTQTGKRLVGQRSPVDIAARGLNLQPRVISQWNSYKYDVIAAMRSGDKAQAMSILKKARANGFIFTKRDISNMRAFVTREKNLQKPNR
jgi:hypothetical protein